MDTVTIKAMPSEGVSLTEKPVEGNTITYGNYIDDFDTVNDKWEVFLDETNNNTRLFFHLDRKTKHSGTSSIYVYNNIETESWATLSHILPYAMDWSHKSGISLFIRMPDNQGPVTLVVYNGRHDDLRPFDAEQFIEALF